LERDNFWDALKGIIKNTTAGTALHADFELRGKLPELPRIWQENLLHIGQEALTNTLKYADAKNFRARLTCNGKGVRCVMMAPDLNSKIEMTVWVSPGCGSGLNR
jgi:signal transduction histidine kinase